MCGLGITLDAATAPLLRLLLEICAWAALGAAGWRVGYQAVACWGRKEHSVGWASVLLTATATASGTGNAAGTLLVAASL